MQHSHWRRISFVLALLLVAGPLWSQQITRMGLRALNHAGAFHGLKRDSAGNFYTLFEAQDGVRLQKYSADGSQLLSEVHIGQTGDAALALDLDASGNIYVAGISNSLGSLTGTPGTSFSTRAGTRTNSFVARFSPQLTEQWLTFCGAEPMAVASIAVSGSAVYVTGSIFASTLPVTSNGIQQSPAPGSSANGFVESFSAAAGTLQYATYLTGANGDTAPAAIAADSAGNAYIVGFTSATGFPTTAALVPTFRAAGNSTSAGFVSKLTSAGDGFLFSTFVPGNGLTSVAIDTSGSGSVLLSGDVAAGLFPITRVPIPIASQLRYQTTVRMALDGSAVLSSTLMAPATQSIATPAGDGSAWFAGSLQNTVVAPLLPIATTENSGNAFLLHLTESGSIDRGARFGGLPVANSGFVSLPAMEGGVIVLPSGTVAFAGSVAPTLSSDLLSSQTYDLALASAPTSSLPATVRDALPTADCNGSACSGSAGLLALLSPNASAPTLALSIDDLPNLVLRNLGTATANNLQISVTGYQLSSGCGSTLVPAAECSLLLSGSGPGTITVTADNEDSFTTQLGITANVAKPISVLPRELDFGIVTATSSPATRTITVTNLGTTAQTFSSKAVSSSQTAYSLTEASSTCTPSGTAFGKVLAPGGSCTITLALQASGDSSSEGAVNIYWHVAATDLFVTGYTQASSVTLSASTIDFGRQYVGGLRSARYLYLSNNSDGVVAHSPVNSTNSAFVISDGCTVTIQPRSVCRIALTYEAAVTPSSDALSLTVDNQQVTVLGETLPQPSISSAAANPNLRVSPTSVTFNNTVYVTEASSEMQSVSISNTGSVAFPLAVSTTGDFFFNSGCSSVLSAGETCNVQLSFTPTAAGIRQGLLSVTAGSSSPSYVALSGTASPILPAGAANLQFADTPLNTPTVQWYKIAEAFPSLTVSSSDTNFTVLLAEDSGFGHGTPSAASFSNSFTGSCLNCYLGIQFRPTSTGSHTASFTITSRGNGQPTSLQTSGNGVPLDGLILTPVSLDFSTVPVHSSSGTRLLTLTNGTASTVDLQGLAFTGDFAATGESTGSSLCNAGQLTPGAACGIPVRFTPIGVGVRTGSVTVTTSAGTATSAMTGMANDDPGIAVAPIEVNFDNVPGGGATTQSVTITNTSSAAVTVSSLQVTDGHFSVASTCGALASNASCTLSVAYTPADTLVTGSMSFTVTSSPSGAPSTQLHTIPLTGLYMSDSKGLQIAPGEHNSVNFGAGTTGMPGISRVLHVNNFSGSTMTLEVETPRQFALTNSSCGTLAAGSGCDLTVQYTPLTSADVTGTVLVRGMPADSSAVQIALAYLESYAKGATDTLAVTGDLTPTGVLNFGQVASGQTVTRTLTVTNPVTSASTLTVRRIRSERPFTATSTCGLPLAAGQSCAITLTYAPVFQTTTGGGQTTTQTDNGTLVVESDSSDAPRIVYLTASATPAFVTSPTNSATVAAFTTSQGSLTFTSNAVGNASPAQTVVVTNTGTAALHIAQPVLTNGFSANSTCTTLSPGATCSIAVNYVPQSTAVTLGALEIQSDASASLEFVSLLGRVQSDQNTGQAQAITLSPQALTFGRVLVRGTASLMATVTNVGTLPVTLGTQMVSGDTGFSVAASSTSNTCGSAGSVLPAGSSCTIAITFSPASTGTLRGTLSVASSATSQALTIPLSGVGTQPQLTVSASTLSFGDVLLGNTSSLALTLVNSSNLAADGLAFTASAGFRVNSTCGITTINAGSSCAVNVTFAPTVEGTSSGVLTISSTDPASPIQVPLNGNGVRTTGATAGVLSSSPSTLNFGTVSVGSRSTLSMVLSNATATTASSLLFTTSAGFTSTSTCGNTLNPYSTCAVLVTFQPTTSGLITGVLTVQSSGNSAPLSVALTGSGTGVQAQLTIAPGYLSFGSVPVSGSSTLSATLTNTSTSPVNQLKYTTSTGFSAGGTCGATLNSGSSCNLVIVFSPTTTGTTAGTLTVQSTDSASPLNVALSGTGTLLAPRLSLVPTSFDFGSQQIGSTSTLTASLQNTSNSVVSAITLTATTGFAIASNCGTVLSPGSSCSLSIMFSPTLTGAVSGLLTVASSDPASPLTASLTGLGTAPTGGQSAAFTLLINGGTSASTTVQAGLPASYALVLTPTGNFSGTVALTCAADTPVDFAACSLVPSSVTLNGASQGSTVTINTVSAVNMSSNDAPRNRRELLWCLSPAVLLLVPRRRRNATLLVLLTGFILTAVGCGGGGDPRVRYVAPGNYVFRVTATSTNGQTISQTVTLGLTVTPK